MSAATALLERTPVVVEETTLEGILGDSLPKEAAEVLGYTVLKDKRDRRALSELLGKMDLNPFSQESVELYKSAMIQATNTRGIHIRETVAALFGGLGMIMFLISFGPTALGWLVSTNFWIASAVTTVAGGIMFSTTTNAKLGYRAKWQVTDLKGYAQPVPEFVLTHALEIKGKLPDVEFFIHQLTRRQVVLDPFLVVRCGGEEFFLDVWDEPTFNAKREA